MRSVILVAVALGIVVPVAGADAKPFTKLWVFGDSTVDSGWYKISPYSGESSFDSYLMYASTYKIGKPINEPASMSVQVLGSLLSLNALPQNQSGTNYATSGARNSQTNTTTTGFFPNAVPTLTQISHYTQAHTPDIHALYLISSGGNDVSYAVTQVKNGVWTDLQGRTYVKKAANQLGAKIAALQTAGGTHVIVADQPQDFGPSTDNTKPYRALYNTTLKARLTNLGAKFAWGDVNGVRHDIINDSADFHVTNVSNTTPVCTTPASSTGIKSSWALVCSTSSPVSTPTSSSPSNTLFADNEHWSSTAQKILGSYYFCLAKKKWPGRFTSWTTMPPYACSLFGL